MNSQSNLKLIYKSFLKYEESKFIVGFFSYLNQNKKPIKLETMREKWVEKGGEASPEGIFVFAYEVRAGSAVDRRRRRRTRERE